MAVPGKSRSKKRAYHHGDLKAALIKAALTLIGEHGTKGFSLKDAAKIAGVSIAAPYRHFTDKRELLRVIHAEGFARFNAALAEAYEKAPTPEEKLLELGVAYLNFAIAHPAHFQVMFGMRLWDVPNSDDENKGGFQLLVQGVAALHPTADRRRQMDHVLAAWSLVHGFAMLHTEGSFAARVGDSDPETQLRRTLRLFISQSLDGVQMRESSK